MEESPAHPARRGSTTGSARRLQSSSRPAAIQRGTAWAWDRQPGLVTVQAAKFDSLSSTSNRAAKRSSPKDRSRPPDDAWHLYAPAQGGAGYRYIGGAVHASSHSRAPDELTKSHARPLATAAQAWRA